MPDAADADALRAKQRDGEHVSGGADPAAAGAGAAVDDAARRSDPGALARPGMGAAALDAAAAQKQNKKRRRDGRDRRTVPGAEQPYAPPPEAPDLHMLFTLPPNLVRDVQQCAYAYRRSPLVQPLTRRL